MASFICSPKIVLLLLLLSAIPIAIIISLESQTLTTHYYEYHSNGWLRESTKWDKVNRRFIVAFSGSGGIGVVPLPDDYKPGDVLQEIIVVNTTEADGKGYSGLFIDSPRNRVVVAITDGFGTYSAVAAYDLYTWKRLFFTQLGISDNGKTFANDVTVDAKGNTYVTDAIGTKIWKVGLTGELLSVINSPLFHAKEWYTKFMTLNGIVYHPNGYLIVCHTITGHLFKVEINKDNKVTMVNVNGSLAIADGLALLLSSKLVVAGSNGAKLVESDDDWETAVVVGRSPMLRHRFVSGSVVKDGNVYVHHALGMGYPKKKHVLVEAVFT